jgi:hypothetical protein
MNHISAAHAPFPRRYWTAPQAHRLIAACDSDSGGVMAFCRRRNISYDRLRYWRRRFAAESAVPDASPFVELRAAKISARESPASQAIIVRLRKDIQVEVNVGFDASLLRLVVEALS